MHVMRGSQARSIQLRGYCATVTRINSILRANPLHLSIACTMSKARNSLNHIEAIILSPQEVNTNPIHQPTFVSYDL